VHWCSVDVLCGGQVRVGGKILPFLLLCCLHEP
jgi:hypothetical protein